MKKKLIFMIVCFLLNVCIVSASEYKCGYTSSVTLEKDWLNKTDNFSFKINYDEKSIDYGNWLSGALDSEMDNEKYSLNNLFDRLNDKDCPESVYVCKYESLSPGIMGAPPQKSIHYALVFDENLFADLDSLIMPQTVFNHTIDSSIKTENCFLADYSQSGSDPDTVSKTTIFKCEKYNKLLDLIENRYTEYTSCKKSKKTKCTVEDDNGNQVTKSIALVAKEHSVAVEEIKSYCKSVIANQNYRDSCMTNCLSLESDLETYLLNKSIGEDKCALTVSIITFISNILKWAKYIAPILVIILSILDFIKAIAAQNDDDMKKAQGKFVKRLIVAALLFLLPLIINFMLKTFGLYNSACDISNLFS